MNAPDDVLGPLRVTPTHPRDQVMTRAAAELVAYMDEWVKRHTLSAAEVAKITLVVAGRQADVLCFAERNPS